MWWGRPLSLLPSSVLYNVPRARILRPARQVTSRSCAGCRFVTKSGLIVCPEVPPRPFEHRTGQSCKCGSGRLDGTLFRASEIPETSVPAVTLRRSRPHSMFMIMLRVNVLLQSFLCVLGLFTWELDDDGKGK
jgi:hypothetical protein